MSSPVWFSIPEFTGIQQHKDGRLLPISSAYDARNIDTSDGNMNVAKGFSRYKSYGYNVDCAKVPDTDTILKLIPVRIPSGTYDLFVVTKNYIYRHDVANNAWSKVKDKANAYDFQFDAVLDAPVNTLYTRIGNDDVVVICTGQTPCMYVLNPRTGRAYPFGSGDKLVSAGSGAITAYDSGTLTVTLDWNMTDTFKTSALIRGVVFVHNNVVIASADIASFPASNKIELAYAPSVTPDVADEVWVRGQQSYHNINIATMYANRLFAAVDMSHPIRLYWSAVPGDGRTIEDWTMADGSEDASGGYVEVGLDSTDEIVSITALSNQLLIWKQRSVWRLLGDRPSTFTLELIGRNAGELANSVPLIYHDAPYMLTNRGMLTYDTVDIVPVNSDGNHLKRYLADKDFAFGVNAFYNNRMYFCGRQTPLPSHLSDNNLIVTFDLATGSFMVRDGFEIADLVAFGDDLLLINKDRYVYKFESGTTYNGSAIHAYWQTQPIDFGRKMYRHQLMGMYMQLTGGDVKINITGDYAGSSKELVAKKDTTRKGYIAVRVQTDQSNEFSFTFDNKTDNSTYTNFAIKGGINIKTLSELKE